MENPTHPPTSKMVIEALEALRLLGNHRGSSFTAIKNYIFSKYDIDPIRRTPHIKKYIKDATEKGTIIRTKGVGCSGSFKLAPVKPESKKPLEAKSKSDKKPPDGKSAKTLNKPQMKKPIKNKGNMNIKKSVEIPVPASAATFQKVAINKRKKKISLTAKKVRMTPMTTSKIVKKK